MFRVDRPHARFVGQLAIPILIGILLLSPGISEAGPLSLDTAAQAYPAADGMNFYYGNLHSHTLYSDGTGFPAQAYTWARDTAGFDFYAITDHSEYLTQAEWDDTGVQAELFNQEGEFITLRGFEWSHPIYGHMNAFGTDDYTDRYNTPDLESFYAWLDERGALAQFNHPARITSYFHDFTYDQSLTDNICLYETGNGPSGNNDVVHLERYPVALDRGWKLAPADNQDNHALFAYGHRTVIISPELTREALFAALRARRVYSTDDPNMRVVFKQGQHWMGSTVEQFGETVQFDIAVEDDENIASLQLMTEGGKEAARKDFNIGDESKQVSWNPTVSVEKNTYYYLKVVERDENGDDDILLGEQVAVTAPIWLEVEGTNWYLAEGCTEGGFETWVLVQNPGDTPAQVALTFMTENGAVEGPTATLAPNSRVSWPAGEWVTSFHVSTKVESNVPVVAERAVYWGNRIDGHDSIGFPGN